MNSPQVPAGRATVKVVPELVVHSPAGTYRVRQGEVCRIGRAPELDIVLDDQRVSFVHAELRVEADGWVVNDLGSRNGVFVDGGRTSHVELRSGSEIRLADADDGPSLRCTFEPMRLRYPRPVGDGDSPGPPQHPAPPPTQKIARNARTVMPRVDAAPTRTFALSAATTTIGRAADNDLVLPELEISRHHARLHRTSQGVFEIEDLGSANGTFVNGQPVLVHPLTEHDIVGMGHSTFRLTNGQLRQFVDEGEISIKAHELTVQVGHGKVLLDRSPSRSRRSACSASSARAAPESRPWSAR